MAHFKRSRPSRHRTARRRLKRPMNHRLRRLRAASDCKFDGISDAFRIRHCDGFKGLTR